MHMLFDLTGKRALVTGCGNEYGRAMAAAVAEYGADVVGVDHADMSQVAQEIAGYGREFQALSADLSQTDCIPDIVSQVVAGGPIDILINAAETKEAGVKIADLTYEEYLRVVELNQNASVRMALLVFQQMLKQGTGGKIINVSSTLAYRMSADRLSYTITKNAIIGLTRAMALEGAGEQIWVNAIAPGVIGQTRREAFYPYVPPAFLEWAAQYMQPAHRQGTMQDLKGTTVFLASKASDYIAGQTICVDGGFVVRM